MRSRRVTNFFLALLLVCAGLVASFAVATTAPAQAAGTTGTDTTTEPTATAPYVIPDGVTIGGVAVAGMNIAMAGATVESFFSSSLPLRIGTKQVGLNPATVGADADIDAALLRAEAAQPGEEIPLTVGVDPALLSEYVDSLAKRFDHPAVDARAFLSHMRPRIAEGTRGQQIRKTAAKNAIRSPGT
jgi:hypothetical protein